MSDNNKRINPERLHTLGLPLSNGRKPDYREEEKYRTVDRYGKTEDQRWLEEGRRND